MDNFAAIDFETCLLYTSEDTATLHRWHTQQGMHLNEEMMKIFKDKVVGFPTLMAVSYTHLPLELMKRIAGRKATQSLRLKD